MRSPVIRDVDCVFYLERGEEATEVRFTIGAGTKLNGNVLMYSINLDPVFEIAPGKIENHRDSSLSDGVSCGRVGRVWRSE